MSSEPSAPPAPPDDGAKGARLHIRGIREMPAGHDAQLAIIFKEMRRASGASKEEIARRLSTSLETITELERGAVLALPQWPELERIVSAYTTQLGLDARPVLRRLKAQIVVEDPLVTPPPAPAPAPARPPAPAAPPAQRAAPPAPPRPPAAAPPARARTGPPQPPPQKPPRAQRRDAPPQSRPQHPPQRRPQSPRAEPARPQDEAPAHGAEGEKPGAGRLARSLRPVVSWLILFGFVAALGAGVWYAAKRPRAVWSALDSLPAPIPRLMRSAWELVRPLEPTRSRPQLSDPDRRKSDKLR